MKNAILFFKNFGNPRNMELRKIGFFNLWAFDDWTLYAGPGLHWSTCDRTLILAWEHAGELKSIRLLRFKPARA